jgi:hypothetical protein
MRPPGGSAEEPGELRENVLANEPKAPGDDVNVQAFPRATFLEMYERMGAEIHLRIWGQHQFGNHCAVFKRDPKVVKERAPHRPPLHSEDWSAAAGANVETVGNDGGHYIQDAVLVESGESVQDVEKVAQTTAAAVRLNLLDECPCSTAQSVQLLCTVVLKASKVAGDRELRRELTASAERWLGQLPDQMIQARAEIVDGVSQDDAPMRRNRLIELHPIIPMEADNVGYVLAGRGQPDVITSLAKALTVVLGDELYGLTIMPGLDLPIEKVEMVLCTPKLQQNAVQ